MTATVPPVTVDLTVPQPLERGFTLPAHWYTDPAIFALEKARILQRFWQYVGYVEQVARPGDFFTSTLGDVPIVVLRDDEGAVRAFANVCRHRGSELVLDRCGSRKTIQCHYHGWTWNLNGSLRSAPRWNEQPAFSKDEFPLVPLKLETWGPMIFVNADPQAGPLSGMVGELQHIVAATGLDLGALRFRLRREVEIKANWKVVVENFNECYHCAIAHPSFTDLIDVDSYKVVTAHEWFSTQHGGVRDAAKEGKGDGIYDLGGDKLSEGVHEGCFSMIFPATMLVINPGPHNMGVLSLFPIDEHRTIECRDTFFSPAVSDEDVQAMVDFGWQVFQEDVTLCESVQRGLRSGFFDQGRLIVSRENGIQHFQQLVHRVLTGGQG